MDFFQHRYYRLNKTLLTLIGYWPYQSTCTRIISFVMMILILTSQAVPQMLALLKHRNDKRIIMECIAIFLYEAVCLTKVISMTWNAQKARQLLNRIRTDWQVWARDREVNILHKYAEQGRKMAIVYTGQTSMVTGSSEVDKSFIDLSTLYTAQMYAALTIYITQPIIPTIIDVLLKNGTAPRKFPFPVDFYHLDAQKYYWYIIMHTYVCVCTSLIIIVATEITLIIYVQHVCGIFAALRQKLRRIGNTNVPITSGRTTYVPDMVDFPSYIGRHNDAISYANLIDATQTWTIFFVIGFGVFLFNLEVLQILLINSDPETTVRYIGTTLGTMWYFYIKCDISEILLYHSISIHLYIHKTRWYNLAPKAQKHLLLMMMLCRVPCQLTAGKNITLSMRCFGQTAKTATSYFMFMRSMYI